MSGDDLAGRLSELATLAEPVRLRLYQHVMAQAAAVSRDLAAEAVGVPRHTAKFHLDRLADEGLLDVEFRRLTGREGPGAGRPAKLYRRSEHEVDVSLPPRQYNLAGHLMAAAIEESGRDRTPITQSLHRTASRWGSTLAQQIRESAGPRPSREQVLATVCATLGSWGYLPDREGSTVILRNCPFHALAKQHTDLVCGMNLAAIEAIIEELPPARLAARLSPSSGRCCVTISES